MERETAATSDYLIRLLAEQAEEFAIILLDTAGHITWWSPGAATIFGIPNELAVGKHFSILFAPEDREKGIDAHEMVTAAGDGAAEDDRWLQRADGARFWANGALIALHNEEGECIGYGKILRDRLDIKEQLETLRNQYEAAQAVNNRKDVFLSTLSHELRNPLAPLSNAVRLIRMTVPDTPELEYPLRIIERQVASLARLTDDLLDITRISAGKIELKKQVLALQDVLRAAVESVRPASRDRRQQLHILLPPSPLLIDGDADRLIQVFVNILNNGIKFTPDEGNIWVKATTEGEEVVAHVQDDGVGISPEMLPRIFDLFTQAESTRGQSQGGLGIGLALVKDLVALHGGSVQVRSDGLGKGSEFSVRLPRVSP